MCLFQYIYISLFRNYETCCIFRLHYYRYYRVWSPTTKQLLKVLQEHQVHTPAFLKLYIYSNFQTISYNSEIMYSNILNYCIWVKCKFVFYFIFNVQWLSAEPTMTPAPEGINILWKPKQIIRYLINIIFIYIYYKKIIILLK